MSDARTALSPVPVAPLSAKEARRIGEAAHRRVRDYFLGPYHLARYFELIERLIESENTSELTQLASAL